MSGLLTGVIRSEYLVPENGEKGEKDMKKKIKYKYSAAPKIFQMQYIHR